MAQGGQIDVAALKLRRQMGEVVEVVHAKLPVFIEEMRNAGILEDGHGLAVVEGNAQQLCEYAADGDAVGGDDHGAAGVLLRDLVQRRQRPGLHLLVGLGSGEIKMLLIVHKSVEQLRLLPDNVGKGLGLPGADVDLPQALVRLHGQIVVFCDGGGCEARTPEVAGVNGVHRDSAKALGQGVPLPYPERRHAPVPPSQCPCMWR